MRSTRHTPVLFGIPIYIKRSWFVIAALMTWTLSRGYFPEAAPGLPVPYYWSMGAAAALLLFICVLLHELGHSLAARGYGIPVACVTLFIFGGVAHITAEPRRPAVELSIALAGPLISLSLAATCWWIAGVMAVHSPLALALWAILHYLAVINTGLLLFNLLPGFPLDGGRVLRAAIWAWSGSLDRATRLASLVGSLIGLLLLAWGIFVVVRGSWANGVWYVLLGFFLRDAAQASYHRAGGTLP